MLVRQMIAQLFPPLPIPNPSPLPLVNETVQRGGGVIVLLIGGCVADELGLIRGEETSY